MRYKDFKGQCHFKTIRSWGIHVPLRKSSPHAEADSLFSAIRQGHQCMNANMVSPTHLLTGQIGRLFAQLRQWYPDYTSEQEHLPPEDGIRGFCFYIWGMKVIQCDEMPDNRMAVVWMQGKNDDVPSHVCTLHMVPALLTQVFLGGTCTSSWRDGFIPLLKIPYFNPVITGRPWVKEDELYEEEAKKESFFHLYVISPHMEGYYSVAEMTASAAKGKERCLVFIMHEDNGLGWTNKQARSWEATERLLGELGAKVFRAEGLLGIADYLNRWEGYEPRICAWIEPNADQVSGKGFHTCPSPVSVPFSETDEQGLKITTDQNMLCHYHANLPPDHPRYSPSTKD